MNLSTPLQMKTPKAFSICPQLGTEITLQEKDYTTFTAEHKSDIRIELIYKKTTTDKNIRTNNFGIIGISSW